MRPERLELDPEEIRAVGHRMVDLLIEHLHEERSVGRRSPREELERLLREEPPEGPSDPLAVLERLAAHVLSHLVQVDHPRFFAFVPGPGNVMGALVETLAAGINVFAGTWLESSGPSQIELVVLDWLRTWCGLPDGAGGLFLSGGSAANLTALAAVLHEAGSDRSRTAVYWSDQTHSSVDRAARVLGMGRITRIPSRGFRLPTEALREAVERDRREGLVPLAVVANAGTTNTGAVDPLDQVADLCAAEGLWLHVDGAYGAAAALTERGRVALAGMGRADSLALDPHKWLFQPYEIGCLLVRRPGILEEAFAVLPEYLRDARGPRGEVDFCDRGLQLTRSARALKLWGSLQTFGLTGFRAAIDHGLDLAEHAQEVLEASPEWELVTPASLAVVTFRHRRMEAGELAGRLLEDGFGFLSTTELAGETVLRMCTINPRTTFRDVENTLGRLEELAAGG